MTVEELIQELEQLPGAAQSAVVWVNDSSEPDISYENGHVYISVLEDKDWRGYD